MRKMMLSRFVGQAAEALEALTLDSDVASGFTLDRRNTMQTQSGGLRRIKAFATEAGVSVRTLHLYARALQSTGVKSGEPGVTFATLKAK